jgi:hypothetical protein
VANQRKALVIATDRYADPALRQLAAPAADAAALAEVLSAPDLGDFTVELLTNAPSWEVDGAVETLFTESDSSDLLLLHFSCHGIKDERGELFLAASNTVPNRLMSTAVEAAQVSRLMQRSRAQRIVLLLDCCYGGAFERGMVARAAGDVDVADQFAQQTLAAGRGRVVITSSSAMEYAFEGTTLTDSTGPTPSLFTGALVDGIRTGEADRDQDGQVALHELYDYVHDKVREQTPNQTPSKWEFGVQGDLVVARNPRRKITAGPLPRDLVQLTEHPNASMRLAAVAELEQAAVGSDLPTAAGARAKLRELQNDDSHRVCREATEALARTSVRVSPDSFDAGNVPRGPRVQLQAVVEGSPLALASTVSSSLERLDPRIDGRDLRICVDTSVAGAFDGVIRLGGPAGEAEVSVHGVVVEEGSTPASKVPPPRVPVDAPEPQQAPVDQEADSAPPDPPRDAEPAPPEPVTSPVPDRESPPAPVPATVQRSGDIGGRALVGAGAVTGAAALALSFLLTQSGALATVSDGLRIDPPGANVWLLGLPTVGVFLVPVVAASGVDRARARALFAGVLLAGALWSWVLCVRVWVPAAALDGVGTTISGTFQTALWLRLAAAIAFSAAGATLVRRWPEASAGPGVRRDVRAYLGATIVLLGALVLPAALVASDKTPEAVAGGWAQVVMFWLAFVPLAVLRLNRVQRDIAVTTTAAFVIFAGVRAASVSTPSEYQLDQTGAGVIMLLLLLAGVLLSQLARKQDT